MTEPECWVVAENYFDDPPGTLKWAVITTWLGAYDPLRGNPPALFETVVLNHEYKAIASHYWPTIDEALAGHEHACRMAWYE